MAQQTSISFNLDGLEDIARKLGDSLVARVGILGSDVARKGDDDSDLTNSEIGAIQEFGSETANIPPRSFLRMPVETHAKEIMKSMDTPAVRKAVEAGDAVIVFKILGIAAEGFVKQAFSTGGFGKWAANKPSTIDRKGSSKPLIDTGELRRSITSDVAKKGDF